MSKSIAEPSVLFHAKWVAKIALLVALVAAAGLLAAVFWVSNDGGGSYGRVVFSHSLTQQKLAPVMVMFGLLLVTLAAVATWLIALYSSHRIAGPLFRFAQNIKTISGDSFTVPLAIRKTDQLQLEWQEFDVAQKRLREHYGDLRDAVDNCRQSLASHGGGPELTAAIARLQEVERRVQI